MMKRSVRCWTRRKVLFHLRWATNQERGLSLNFKRHERYGYPFDQKRFLLYCISQAVLLLKKFHFSLLGLPVSCLAACRRPRGSRPTCIVAVGSVASVMSSKQSTFHYPIVRVFSWRRTIWSKFLNSREAVQLCIIWMKTEIPRVWRELVLTNYQLRVWKAGKASLLWEAYRSDLSGSG